MKIPYTLSGLFLAATLAGCNLFNPSEDNSVHSDDSKALVYEGQLKFRNGEYASAGESFGNALSGDSTLSEAWFGLAKANIYANGFDPFKLVELLDLKTGEIPLMNLDSEEVAFYYKGVKSALGPLRELVRRDTLTANDPALGLSDRKVTYSNFSASYAFLEFAYVFLDFRQNVQQGVILSLDSSGNISIDIGALYANAIEDPALLDNFNSGIDSLATTTERIVNDILPTVVTLLDGSDLLADSLTDTTNVSKLLDETVSGTAKSIEDVISFYKLGDGIDNDGDGCVDEEVRDGKDNDGDGLIDEDLRIVPLAYDADSSITFIGIGKDSLDHDIDGVKEDSLERTLSDSGRLLFAIDFKTIAANDSLALDWRTRIAKDTDSTAIAYPLEVRKNAVGRCWNNYNEETFKAWFRNR